MKQLSLFSILNLNVIPAKAGIHNPIAYIEWTPVYMYHYMNEHVTGVTV